MQAGKPERSATAEPALERRDLAREGVKEKNQSRGLTLDFLSARLSGPSDASKIVAVLFTFSLARQGRYPSSMATGGGAA
jgi:hypothetical protein